MKKVNNRKSKKQILEDINIYSRILKEAYGDYEDMGYEGQPMSTEEEIPYNRQSPEEGYQMANQKPFEEEERMPEDEREGEDLSRQDEKIAKIREISLEGLQEYAENVDSEMYQFYKKVWLMCDKACSEKDSASDGGNK